MSSTIIEFEDQRSKVDDEHECFSTSEGGSIKARFDLFTHDR